ncbi:MAG: hypothetical protein ACYS74_07700, partial [Planctomycetota bacterium]
GNRDTEIAISLGYAAAMIAPILWLFDQSLVLLHIAQMKSLRYDIAQMLGMRLGTALRIRL